MAFFGRCGEIVEARARRQHILRGGSRNCVVPCRNLGFGRNTRKKTGKKRKKDGEKRDGGFASSHARRRKLGECFAMTDDHLLDDQMPFPTPDIVGNPEPRCPCLLLLDTSGSMRGKPIAELNAGLIAFKDELTADAMATQRVEVGIITFGPVQVESAFQTPA